MQLSSDERLWDHDEKSLFNALEDYLYSRGSEDALGFVAGWVVFTAKRTNLPRSMLLAKMHAAFGEPLLKEEGHDAPMRVGTIDY